MTPFLVNFIFSATYRNGVLEVHLPRADEAEDDGGKTIDVRD